MNASQLKYLYEMNERGYFFDRKTMRFFGDTMKNYGVYECKISTHWHGNKHCDTAIVIDAYCLYHKKPVLNNLSTKHYFELDGRHIGADETEVES